MSNAAKIEASLFSGNIRRSYAWANQELVASFSRHLEAMAYAQKTINDYREGVSRFVDTLGSASVVEAERSDVRYFMSQLLEQGVSRHTISKFITVLRGFYRFLRVTDLTRNNPMAAISYPRPPRRLPRVLTVEEVENLIAAAANPFQRAVIEVLYSTGVRVSELVNLRLENIDFAEHVILVKKGKGAKDRYVLFGRHAATAIIEYLRWRPSKEFLFEPPARYREEKASRGRLIRCGPNQCRSLLRDFVSADVPLSPDRRYGREAIGELVQQLGRRAGVGRVHPHALRRAMACHMLSRGANLRVVQELLGHESLESTQLYTDLSATELKKIHTRCHPHAGGSNAEAS